MNIEQPTFNTEHRRVMPGAHGVTRPTFRNAGTARTFDFAWLCRDGEWFVVSGSWLVLFICIACPKLREFSRVCKMRNRVCKALALRWLRREAKTHAEVGPANFSEFFLRENGASLRGVSRRCVSYSPPRPAGRTHFQTDSLQQWCAPEGDFA